MRSILYKNTAQDGSVNSHYVTLERIDHFTFSEQDGKTVMYAISGDMVHKLSDSVKIENYSVLVSKLIQLSDRMIVNIDDVIKDANLIAKSKRK